jgi:hypothetical protein
MSAPKFQMPQVLEANMQATPPRDVPVSHYLERQRFFLQRRLEGQAPIPSTGNHRASRLTPLDPPRVRVLALPFQRRDDDE